MRKLQKPKILVTGDLRSRAPYCIVPSAADLVGP